MHSQVLRLVMFFQPDQEEDKRAELSIGVCARCDQEKAITFIHASKETIEV